MGGDYHVLWADDDADGLLRPLLRELRTMLGREVERARNCADGTATLLAGDKGRAKVDAVLVDVLLASGGGDRTLSTRLGFELARVAAQLGVPRISFLSVVPEADVTIEYQELKRAFPNTAFSYFDKALLLVPGHLNAVVDSLRGA